MFLRIILIVLIVNVILALLLLWSDRSRREKALWITFLAAIPLAFWLIYRILNSGRKIGDLKDWESK